MINSILLGYKKTDAAHNPVGPAVVLSGPPENEAAAQEQAAAFTEARQRHVFPKGIRYVALAEFTVVDAAAFISDEVAADAQNRHAATRERQEHAEAIRKTELKLVELQHQTKKLRGAVALARNNLNGKDKLVERAEKAEAKANAEEELKAAEKAHTAAEQALAANEEAMVKATAQLDRLKHPKPAKE